VKRKKGLVKVHKHKSNRKKREMKKKDGRLAHPNVFSLLNLILDSLSQEKGE